MRHVDSISLFPSKAKGKNKEITATTTPSVFKLAYFELKKKKESQLPENTYLKKSLFLDRKKNLSSRHVITLFQLHIRLCTTEFVEILLFSNS